MRSRPSSREPRADRAARRAPAGRLSSRIPGRLPHPPILAARPIDRPSGAGWQEVVREQRRVVGRGLQWLAGPVDEEVLLEEEPRVALPFLERLGADLAVRVDVIVATGQE